MSGGEQLCERCRHFIQSSVDTGYGRCAAFPAGIPGEIYFEEFIHVKPFLSPSELLFDPIDELARIEMEYALQRQEKWDKLSPEEQADIEAEFGDDLV